MRILERVHRAARIETQAELVKYLTYGVPTLAAYDLMPEETKANLPTAPAKAAAGGS